MNMYKFQLRFHLKFIPKCSINNIPALVQIMAWTSDGKFTDAYVRHLASMS